MRLDPDIVRSKPLSTWYRWQLFASADSMVDEWRALEAEAAMKASANGG